MSSSWIILDANFLCWRSFHSLGGLSYNGQPTAVAFGFFRDIIHFVDKYDPSGLIFAFDGKESKREEIDSTYKQERREKRLDPKEAETYRIISLQIQDLRKKFLPKVGFKNVFFQEGYEADDVVASVCEGLDDQDEAMIVSSDKDLYQCLKHNVTIWNCKERITLQGFYSRYKITPDQWKYVKAIAGCITDGVRGIRGVGEKSAILYLRGELSDSSLYRKRIENGEEEWKRSLELVRLPYKGTKVFTPQRDKLNPEGWDEVCEELGFKYLKGACPSFAKKTLF